MSKFQKGDRVYVTDHHLANLRAILRDATGEEPPPNHHGTVVGQSETSGLLLIEFDDGAAAPYPPSQVRRLEAA